MHRWFRNRNEAALVNIQTYLSRIATTSSGGPYPRTCAVFDTQYGFNSSPFQRLELCGEPQEQYKVHPSHIPSATGARYDPFGYGLNPIKYRVQHLGHSMQCRIRVVMTPQP